MRFILLQVTRDYDRLHRNEIMVVYLIDGLVTRLDESMELRSTSPRGSGTVKTKMVAKTTAMHAAHRLTHGVARSLRHLGAPGQNKDGGRNNHDARRP